MQSSGAGMVTIEQLLELAESTLRAAEFNDYCPNGLQVQGRTKIRRLVSGVTASQALLEAAVNSRADAVLVHHGYFWRGESACLTGIKHQRIATLIRNDLNLIAYHLPLDVHPQFGNNARLALELGLTVDDCTAGEQPGLLYRGHLDQAMTGSEFAERVRQRLGRTPLHVPNERPLRSIAWCTGAGQQFINDAAALGVDAFLTGEVSEATTHYARELGIHFFAAGHHATERYGVQALGAHLAAQLDMEHEFIDIENPA